MISTWPEYSEERAFTKEEKWVEIMKEAIVGIRKVRSDMNVPPSKKAAVYVVTENDTVKSVMEGATEFFATLSYASEVIIQKDKSGISDNAVSVHIENAVIYIPFEELVDIEKEKERLTKEVARLEGEVKRVDGMLNNERFISKAPQAKIDEEKEKKVKYTQMLEQVKERLSALS